MAAIRCVCAHRTIKIAFSICVIVRQTASDCESHPAVLSLKSCMHRYYLLLLLVVDLLALQHDIRPSQYHDLKSPAPASTPLKLTEKTSSFSLLAIKIL